MKRSKDAALTEIIKATGWQTHMLRGFVCILGDKGWSEVESSRIWEKRMYTIK